MPVQSINIQYNTILMFIDDEYINGTLNHQNLFSILKGEHPEVPPVEFMLKLCVLSSRYISRMYRRFIRDRYIILVAL